MMNVLLSAYACFDNYGSEPGVGFRWLNHLLDRGYNVTLATSGWSYESLKNNEALMSRDNFQVIVIGELENDQKYRANRIVYQFYLIAWQYRLSSELKKNSKVYDVVHHITYGGVSIPSFIAKYGGFSIYGPVGGAEVAPLVLSRMSGFKSVVKELGKKLSLQLMKLDPLLLYTRYTFDLILLKNESNSTFFKLFKDKCKVKSEIVVDNALNCNINLDKTDDSNKKIIFSARGIYWKGGDIAIKVAEYIRKNYDIDFTLEFFGEGKEYKRWKRMAKDIDCIRFAGRLSRDEYLERVSKVDCLIFPSYHDSSGNVILESLCKGVPVVSFNLGGPSSILSDDEYLVDPEKDERTIIEEFASKVVDVLGMTYEDKCKMSEKYKTLYASETLLEGVYK